LLALSAIKKFLSKTVANGNVFLGRDIALRCPRTAQRAVPTNYSTAWTM
jgi:hypothetical protein